MAAGSIVIDLLMKTGMFETDVARAEKSLAKWGKQAVRVGKIAGTAFVAAGAALVALTKQVADAGVQIDRLATLSGTMTGEFQKLAYGARTMGVEQDKLADILKDVQDKVGDFLQTGGGPMADFFEKIAPRIGVTAEQFRKLSGPQALQAYVQGLERAKLSQSEMVFYMEALASDSSRLLPLLVNNGRAWSELGDEAARLGGIMDAEVIEASKQLDRDMQQLKTVAQALKIELASELIPAFQDLTSDTLEWVRTSDEAKQMGEDLADAVRGIADALRELGGALEFMDRLNVGLSGLEQISYSWADRVNAVFTGNAAKWEQGIRVYEEGARRLKLAIDGDPFANVRGSAAPMVGLFDNVQSSVSSTYDPKPPSATPKPPGRAGARGLSEEQREAERLQTAYESLMGTMHERIALFGQEGLAAKVRYDLEHGALVGMKPELAELMVAEAERLDLMEQEAEVARELAAIDKSRQESLDRVFASLNLEIEALGKSNEWIATRNALLEAGVTAESEMGQAIVRTVEELYRQGEAIERTVAAMDIFRNEASGALADVLTGTKSLKDGFLDMLDAIHARISQMIADQLIERLFGQMGSTSTGSSGGWIANFASMLFGGAKAGGGDTLPDRAYLVGEQGPELFVPRTAGAVVPAGQTAAALGRSAQRSVTVNQVFNNPVLADRRSDTQRQLEAARRTRIATSRFS